MGKTETNIIDSRFWRDDIVHRTTSTGLNFSASKQFTNRKLYKDIIEYILKHQEPHTDGRKYMPNDQTLRNDYFTTIVNDCLRLMYKGEVGYLHTTDQVKELLRIRPTANIIYVDDSSCWYCHIGDTSFKKKGDEGLMDL